MNLPKVESVEGSRNEPRLMVFSLSTCGFCKRAMEFLREKGFAFDYLHLDQIPSEEKARLKEEFKSEFGVSLAFPTLLIDGKDVIIGFIEAKWKEKLGV